MKEKSTGFSNEGPACTHCMRLVEKRVNEFEAARKELQTP